MTEQQYESLLDCPNYDPERHYQQWLREQAAKGRKPEEDIERMDCGKEESPHKIQT